MSTLTRKKSNVEHANEANFDRLVLDSNVPVLVDFYADWCGPCKMIAPVLEELASETADAKIVKINVDEDTQLAARYGISSIPSLLVFKDGDVADQQVGLANKVFHGKRMKNGWKNSGLPWTYDLDPKLMYLAEE
jgi:thioredoxin 1